MVLYELLTGHRPYNLASAARHEVARFIAEEEPSRPSDVVATFENGTESDGNKQPITPEAVSKVREGDLSHLRKRLRGDLDSIILTTLRKEPARRYSSVEALSEDLQRHLEAVRSEQGRIAWGTGRAGSFAAIRAEPAPLPPLRC